MIELVTTWDALVNALGAAAMLAFGVWVLTLTPRTRATKGLAVFAIAAGAVYVLQNLVSFTGWHETALYNPLWGVGLLVAGLALVGLVRELLDPLEGRARPLWRIALAVPALLVLSVLAPPIVRSPPAGIGLWEALSFLLQQSGLALFFGAFLGLALVLALRYRNPPEGQEGATRTQAVAVSAALILWPAFNAGRWMSLYARPDLALNPSTLWRFLLLAGVLSVAGLWLVNAQTVPERSAEGRNLALLTLAMLLAGTLQGVFVRPLFPVKTGGPLWGVVRLVTVMALGYAILQHEILGVEAKFRWGISKTTVAGIFVAVFFIVSEGAQVLFADVAGGSDLIGVIAAGLLVFAISPLQRFADRFAARAVPGAQENDTESSERRAALYRSTVQRFLADGSLTHEEEQELADLAEELDIGAGEAMRIRRRICHGMETGSAGGDSP